MLTDADSVIDGAELRAFFGRAIKMRCDELGISTAGLAAKTRLSINHVSDIERGEGNIHLPTLFRIAEALEMTATELTERVEIAALVAAAAQLLEPEPYEVCLEVWGHGWGWAKRQVGVGVLRAPITYGVWERRGTS